ncbi:hypothetical protein NOF04DRAFT_1337588 [Fusarium oxysporum II5]|nr:hypothetical protein NOF04DRAFT_1337588 [Fusarium oxysporum II5]
MTLLTLPTQQHAMEFNQQASLFRIIELCFFSMQPVPYTPEFTPHPARLPCQPPMLFLCYRGRERDIVLTSEHNIADKTILTHLQDLQTKSDQSGEHALTQRHSFQRQEINKLSFTRLTTTQKSSIFVSDQDTPNVSGSVTTSLTCRDQRSQYRLLIRSTVRQFLGRVDYTGDNSLFRKQSISQEQRHKPKRRYLRSSSSTVRQQAWY